MTNVEGTKSFQASSHAYDAFMGRYSAPLAHAFADYCLPAPGGRFLDVGCGPGALTGVACAKLGASSVAAVDPALGFVRSCRNRHPGADVRCVPAEELPFADDEFDGAAAQLVFHFVSDPHRAATQMARVVRPGGTVAGAVWDFAEGMEMLRAFWDAALSVDPAAPDEGRTRRFGKAGELAALLTGAGLRDIEETTLTVTSRYQDFDELWTSLLAGVGPAGAYAVAQPPAGRAELRGALHTRLGHPTGPFTLAATARAARGRVLV